MGTGTQNNGHKVCLLDDDASMLKATSRLLESEAWSVESFENPETFLSYAEKHSPRVAVIDIFMPSMNGFEVQDRLRSRAPSTRVIVLTSSDDPAVRDRAMKAGASAFFTKPVNDDEFLARVATLASANGSS